MNIYPVRRVSTDPDEPSVNSPTVSSRVSRARRRLGRVTTVAVCLAGSAAALLAAPATAGATTVDNNAPAYRQPGGIVYSLLKNNDASNLTVLSVYDRALNDGALVDTWAPAIDDNHHGGNITQASQLWEFIPQSDNTGGTITTGFGQLRNRQSGLCLDINGANTDDVATVDQWDCVPGATNEEWKATVGSGVAAGSFVVSSELDGAYLGTNTPNCQPLIPNGNGDPMYARTDISNCTLWTPQRESYRFATNKITVHLAEDTTDPSTYRCIPGYNLRYDSASLIGGSDDPAWAWSYWNISDSGIYLLPAPLTAVAHDQPNPNAYLGDSGGTDGSSLPYSQLYYYYATGALKKTGQLMMYCDPGTTWP